MRSNINLTSTQKSLFEAIKKHELRTGKFCGYPKPSHMGMSLLCEYKGNKQIYSGFQKRTFEELVSQKVIVLTMFCGYRIADDMGGFCDLPTEKQLDIRQSS